MRNQGNRARGLSGKVVRWKFIFIGNSLPTYAIHWEFCGVGKLIRGQLWDDTLS